MKRSLLSLFLGIVTLPVFAQLDPVSWTFTAVKKGDKDYEVQLKANIQDKWHLYSQSQPDDAIVIPTEIKFNPNPLFSTDGKIREEGKMEKYADKNLGISANQYAGTVTFIQKIKVKGKAKTKVTGTVVYQTCDDKKCLPPKTVRFSIDVK